MQPLTNHVSVWKKKKKSVIAIRKICMAGLLQAEAILLMQNHKAKQGTGFASLNYSQTTVTFQGWVPPCSISLSYCTEMMFFFTFAKFHLFCTTWYLDRKYRYLQQIQREKKKNQTPNYFLTSLERKKKNLSNINS